MEIYSTLGYSKNSLCVKERGVIFSEYHFTQTAARRYSAKYIFKSFAKISRKHLCQSLFLVKLQAKNLQLYWKKTPTQVFSYKFCNIFKSTTFIELLQETVAGFRCQKLYCIQANDLIGKYLIRHPEQLFHDNFLIGPFGNLDIGFAALSLASGSTFKCKHCLLHHSHKKRIVWKHGPNWLFYTLMLRTKLY